MKIIIDTREQTPLDFRPFPDVFVERDGLRTGDYSLAGLESKIGVERKSIADLVGSLCSSNRERFIEEIHRARGFDRFALVIEGTQADILARNYKGQAHPNAVIQSVIAIQSKHGITVEWAGNAKGAAFFVYHYFRHYLAVAHQVAATITKLHQVAGEARA